jgi:hypothetical protein
MLLTPFDLLAKAAGSNVLEYAIDIYGHYQGLVGATRRAYARDHETTLIAYIRGYLAGLAWLYDPRNAEAAVAILRQNLPQMSPSLGQQSYAVLVSPWSVPRDLPRGRKSISRAFAPCSSCAAATASRGSHSPTRPNITNPHTIRRRYRTDVPRPRLEGVALRDHPSEISRFAARHSPRRVPLERAIRDHWPAFLSLGLAPAAGRATTASIARGRGTAMVDAADDREQR